MDGFHYDAHPMGMLVSAVAALSTFYPEAQDGANADTRRLQIVRLIAKMPTLAAFAYRHSLGLPYNYPDNELSYTGNFLNMLFKATEPKFHPNADPRARPRSALHPARRSRAELLHQRRPRSRVLAGRPLLRPGRRAWPRSTGRCTAVPTKQVLRMLEEIGSKDRIPAFIKSVKEGKGTAHGLRPSRLQELRPARQDHQAAWPTRCSR